MTQSSHSDEVLLKLELIKQRGLIMPVNLGFVEIYQDIHKDLSLDTNSSKLAAVLVSHQFMQEMMLNLIEHSITYMQAVALPAIFQPKNVPIHTTLSSKTIRYLGDNCVDFRYKKGLINAANTLNSNRNKLVHDLTDKRTGDIAVDYDKFKKDFEKLTKTYLKAEKSLEKLFLPILHKK